MEGACHTYDKNNDGTLDREEFTELLTFGGFGIAKSDVADLVAEADKNGDGIIAYDEFLPAMVKILSKNAEPLELDKGKMGVWAAKNGYFNEVCDATETLTLAFND